MTLRERVGITLLLQQGRPIPVEEELLHAPIVSIRGAQESTENAGTSRVNKVALQTRRVCFHKTAAGIDRPQANRYGHQQFGVLINESAAWMLAKALGAPFDEWVPPTVIRSIWPADQKLSDLSDILEPAQFDAFLARIRRMTSSPREILHELEF